MAQLRSAAGRLAAGLLPLLALATAGAEGALPQAPGAHARQTGAARSDGVQLGALQVRLWYTGTGRLSENIAPPAKFTGWNTIIGEGDAQEPADDALVTVDVVANSGGEENVAAPLMITAHDGKGKVLAQRRVTNILTSRRGHSVQALWLRDVGCAGAILVEAVIGTSRKTTRVELDCGE